MEIENLSTKISELEIRFEGLKDAMSIFQDNINNNIYWFYSVLSIFIALVGAVGVALYFLVRTSVSKGIEKGINDVSSIVQIELADLKTQINELENSQESIILKVLRKNPQIKWANGTTSSVAVKQNILRLRGFVEIIDWDSPITHLELVDSKNSEPIEFEIVEFYNDGMEVKVEGLKKDKITIIDYTFVWTTHDID